MTAKEEKRGRGKGVCKITLNFFNTSNGRVEIEKKMIIFCINSFNLDQDKISHLTKYRRTGHEEKIIIHYFSISFTLVKIKLVT